MEWMKREIQPHVENSAIPRFHPCLFYVQLVIKHGKRLVSLQASVVLNRFLLFMTQRMESNLGSAMHAK